MSDPQRLYRTTDGGVINLERRRLVVERLRERMIDDRRWTVTGTLLGWIKAADLTIDLRWARAYLHYSRLTTRYEASTADAPPPSTPLPRPPPSPFPLDIIASRCYDAGGGGDRNDADVLQRHDGQEPAHGGS